MNSKLSFHSVGPHFLPTEFLGIIINVIQVVLNIEYKIIL
jgi:hypothetical protein